MAVDDKALVASSEFNAAEFIAGIDAMTAGLQKLSAAEDTFKSKLTEASAALGKSKADMKAVQDQIAALDKTSSTYTQDLDKLNKQQVALAQSQRELRNSVTASRTGLADITKQSKEYEGALRNIETVTAQVAANNNGKTLFDTTNLAQQTAEVQAAGAKVRDVFKDKIPTQELDQLEISLAASSTEFEELARIIDFIKPKLQQLDPNSEEFRELNTIVSTGEDILANFGTVLENVNKQAVPLKTQLKEITLQLQQMELAGQTDTEEFANLTQQAGKLRDAIRGVNEAVSRVGDGELAIKAVGEAAQGLVGAFAVAQGVTAAFGVNSEELQETLLRVNAAMAVLQGLQQISTVLQKESNLMLALGIVQEKAYIITNRILAATLGTTAAASRGLNTALAATGFGAILLGILAIVAALKAWSDATEEQKRQQLLLNTALEANTRINTDAVAAIGDAGKQALADAERRQEENARINASDTQKARDKARNAEELRKIDESTLEDQLQTTRRLEARERTVYDEAANRRRDALEGRIEIDDDELDALNTTIDGFTKIQETGNQLENQLNLTRTNNARARAAERNEIRQAEINAYLDYLKRLQELQDRLKDAQDARERQDGEQLAAQSATGLSREIRAINADVRRGALSKEQGNTLKSLLKQVNDVELAQVLEDYNKQAVAAANALQDAITQVQAEADTARIALLRDDLEQQSEQITATYQQETEQLRIGLRDSLAGIQDAFDQGLISESTAQRNAQNVRVFYDIMFDQIEQRRSRAAEDLARSIFERAQADITQVFAGATAIVSETQASEVQALANQFVQGRISYERYQQDLTALNRRYSTQRIAQDIREREQMLAGLQARLTQEQDPETRKALQDQIISLRTEIANLKAQLAQADAEGTKADQDLFDARIARLISYASAIGGIISQVSQFWASVNEAEQRSLEKSIGLQEERVNAATRIAERGNAEYLRLEEDRLNQLEVQRTNAANRQLAINAVIQTSQALTAFVTALAQGIATGGPLGGLAIAASVIGAIASGYAIIQSLQPETQRLFRGTKNVRRKGQPAGVDTVPAMLTEGEAVIPVSQNREYGEAVGAIYDRAVPAEEMNAFVRSYKTNQRSLPRLATDRMSESAAAAAGITGELLAVTRSQGALIEEQTAELRGMRKAFAKLAVNINLDRHGLSVGVLQAIEEHKKSSKA